MNANHKSFEVGDEVEWTSQAAGIVKAKRGTVEMIVPRGKRPEIKGVGFQRDHVSYVVRVRQYNANGKVIRTQCYWPRVSALRLVQL